MANQERHRGKYDDIRLTNRQISAILIGMVETVLFWRGVRDISARMFSPYFSLIVGTIMLTISVIIGRKFVLSLLGAG